MVAPVPGQPTPNPTMTYIDLGGKSLSLNQFVSLDVDGDKKLDIYFYTQAVSDNIYHLVKDQFIGGAYLTYKMNFGMDEAGEDILAILSKGQDLKTGTNNDTWFNVSEAVMMQHVQNTATDKIYWEGNWANKGTMYLPFQRLIPGGGGQFNYGWVEMEASVVQQKLIFYRAAICKEAGLSVKAGL